MRANFTTAHQHTAGLDRTVVQLRPPHTAAVPEPLAAALSDLS
jgi:hypothetical protein